MVISVRGASGMAILSIVVGIILLTRQQPILLQLLPDALIGLFPCFHYGIPWGYTWDEFYSSTANFRGKRAIVTGANSGIGYDTTVALVRAGVSVVTMVCRNPKKCQTARDQILQEIGGDDSSGAVEKSKLDTMTMDTSSLASVRAFAENYIQKHGTDDTTGAAIDMIFMNAGTNYFVPPTEKRTKCPPKTSEDQIDYLFQVNYLSHHLLYQLLEPMILNQSTKRGGATQIIQTSSCSSFLSYSYGVATNIETLHGCTEPHFNFWLSHNTAYGQSKLAQILWVKALTRRRRQMLNDNNTTPKIYANAYHPGAVSTPIIDKLLDTCGDTYFCKLMTLVRNNLFWQSPDGALTGLYLAVNPHGVSGKYYHPQVQEISSHPYALNETLQDELWEFSNQLVQDYLDPIELPSSPAVAAAAAAADHHTT